LYILTYDRENEGQGSLMKIMPSPSSEVGSSSPE
jgi:hypothetical protein